MLNADSTVYAREPLRSNAWWSLGVISFLGLLDYADRAIIGAIAEPIKSEFALTDAQTGMRQRHNSDD